MPRPEFIPEEEWVYVFDYLAKRFYDEHSLFGGSIGDSKSYKPILEKSFMSSFDWAFGLTLNVLELKKIIYSEFRERNFFVEVSSKFSGLTYQITDRAKFFVEVRKKDSESCLYDAPENTYEIIREGFFNLIEKYEDGKFPATFEFSETFLDNISSFEISSQEHDKTQTGNQNFLAGESVPASNRVVSLDHNSPPYIEAVEALNYVMETVRGDNEYGNRDPEDKEQQLSALSAGCKLLESSRVAFGMIEAVVMKTLLYLAGIGVAVAQVADAIAKVKVLFG